MSAEIIDIAKRKPVEVLSSLVMIGAGVYLSGTGNSGSFAVVFGNLLSAFGGILLSWSFASLTTKEAAAEILRPQLSAIGRQLVTVSGQISKAVHDAKCGDLDQEVALQMVSQASRIMYASVNEIHVVLNQQVDSQQLIDTAQRVEDLATMLAGSQAADQDQVESELAGAIAELRTQIHALATGTDKNKVIPKANPDTLETIITKCPACAAEATISIGRAFGSSAMPTCICGVRFHAHRARDGSVFTNTPGSHGH